MALIQGTNIASPVRPYDRFDKYPTHEAIYGKGGHRTVQNKYERNAIPKDRRELLMTVGVVDEGIVYILNTNPTTDATTDVDWGINNSNNIIIDITTDTNNKLSLLPDKMYKTPAVSTVNIDLVSNSRYNKIFWNLSIGTQVPTLTFDNTLYWRYDNDLEFIVNSYAVFEFETWDNGATWFAKVHKYSIGTPDDFLTKTEVADMIGGWQTLY